MTFGFGPVQIYIGRHRDAPITYDDLVDAETRAFEAEEKVAILESKLERLREYRRRTEGIGRFP